MIIIQNGNKIELKNNLVITELLKDGDAEVILSDFNAG